MRVGILGGGQWGQALARLVMAAGNEPFIAYRDKKPPQMLPSSDKPEEVSGAVDLILVATSARETRNAIQLAKPGPRHRVVVAGRGLEPATGRWLTDVVLEECDALRVGALAGPAPVEEILNGGLCAGVIGSRFQEVNDLTTEALHSSRYRVYESADLNGLQLAGAMVPVLASLLGMAGALRGSGVGIQGLVLSRGLEEAGRLARAISAEPMTFSGLAGVGDLVAAQAKPGHPSFEAGVQLVKRAESKKKRKPITKGPVPIAHALAKMAREHGVELPLTEALVAIDKGANPLDVVTELMARKAQPEFRS